MMRYIDPMSQPISGPIPVPGTQQAPTVPFLGGSTSTNTPRTAWTSSCTLFLVGPNHGLDYSSPSSHNHNSNSRNKALSSDPYYANNSNINSHCALRRLPTLGKLKRLGLENTTLRSKITELERYLTGLKKELILANRQIHAHKQDRKMLEELKAGEIHVLGEHIQKCEVDLLARSAECEALQAKLQHCSKEQVVKLRQISILETEIRDYKRLSALSSYYTSGGGSGSGGGRGGGGGLSEFAARNSRHSSDLSESVRSATVFGVGTDAAQVQMQLQIRQLKGENLRKDEQMEELLVKIAELTANVSRLEHQQQEQQEQEEHQEERQEEQQQQQQQEQQQQQQQRRQEEEEPVASILILTPSKHISKTQHVSISTSDISSNLSTSTSMLTAGHGASSSSLSPSTTTVFSVNSVGYDLSLEHPKLLARYQALRMQHAQASEYLDVLESENQELKVQLLDINSSIAEIVNDIPSTNYIQTQPQPQPQSRTVAVYSTTSASSLHHPAASKLTPLDMDVAATAVAARRGASKYVSSTSSSSPAVTSTTTPSSPTSPMLAPILTHKSSLRYSKDSQVSPPTTDVALTFQ